MKQVEKEKRHDVTEKMCQFEY